MGLGMMGFDFAVHQRLDLVRVEIARDHHAQIVGQKLDDMVVGHQLRIVLKHRRRLRIFHIGLDRHQAFLARLLQQLVQKRHHFHIARLVIARGLERRGNRLGRGLEHLGLVADDESAQGATANGHHLERQRLDKNAHAAAVQHIHAEDAAEGDDITDENKHDADCEVAEAPP